VSFLNFFSSVAKEEPMSIDVFSETVVTLTEATKRLPKLNESKRLHVTTMYRWVQRGCLSKDGTTVRLETIKIGGTTCTSLEALQRFFDQLNGDTAVRTPRTITSKSRLRQIEAAERELREAGI
jgi:hypothetical protein